MRVPRGYTALAASPGRILGVLRVPGSFSHHQKRRSGAWLTTPGSSA